MQTLSAANVRGLIFDLNGEAYVFAGSNVYNRLHHVYPGRTEPIRSYTVRGQILAPGYGALFASDASFVNQVYADGTTRQTMAVLRSGVGGAHRVVSPDHLVPAQQEVVWMVDGRTEMGRTWNRVPIGGTTLLDLGNGRRADQVGTVTYGYVRAFELFGMGREEDWHFFNHLVCGDWVAVMRAPNITHEVPAALAIFHIDDWKSAVVHHMPKEGGEHSWTWFQQLGRGYARSIEPGRWMYYPVGPADPREIKIPTNDALFDVCGDLFISGRGRTSGVRVGRAGEPVREYQFHGPRTPSSGGALTPDGLTGYAWSGKELVQFDIDL